MYLAQFYDDAATVGMHPSIAIDSGYMLASQVAAPYSPVGEGRRGAVSTPHATVPGLRRRMLVLTWHSAHAGYWQSDKSRFTACILHASGADNYIPLRKQYCEGPLTVNYSTSDER